MLLSDSNLAYACATLQEQYKKTFRDKKDLRPQNACEKI